MSVNLTSNVSSQGKKGDDGVPSKAQMLRRRGRIKDMPQVQEKKKWDFEKWFLRFEKRHLETVEREKYEKCRQCLFFLFVRKKKKKLTFKQLAKIQRSTISLNMQAQRRKRLNFKNIIRQLRKVVRVQLAFSSKFKYFRKVKLKELFRMSVVLGGWHKRVASAGPRDRPSGPKVAAETAASDIKRTADSTTSEAAKVDLVGETISADSKAGDEILVDAAAKAAEIERQQREKREAEQSKMSFIKLMKMRRVYGIWRKNARNRKEFNLKRSKSLVGRQKSMMKDLSILDVAMNELTKAKIQTQLEIDHMMPSFNKALDEAQLPDFNVTRMRFSLRFSPALPIQMLFAGICMLKGIEPIYIINGGRRDEVLAYNYLPASQKLIAGNLRKNLEQLQDPDHLFEENFEKFREFVMPHPEFDRKKIEKCYADCALLYDWIETIEKYAKIAFQIKERREMLKFIGVMEDKLKKGISLMRDQLAEISGIREPTPP